MHGGAAAGSSVMSKKEAKNLRGHLIESVRLDPAQAGGVCGRSKALSKGSETVACLDCAIAQAAISVVWNRRSR